jgi:hypothetical protein
VRLRSIASLVRALILRRRSASREARRSRTISSADLTTSAPPSARIRTHHRLWHPSFRCKRESSDTSVNQPGPGTRARTFTGKLPHLPHRAPDSGPDCRTDAATTSRVSGQVRRVAVGPLPGGGQPRAPSGWSASRRSAPGAGPRDVARSR